MVDCAFIVGTDESYSISDNFTEVWYNEDSELRNKWREAIRKEIEDWTKRGMLEYMEVKNKPTEKK